MKKIELQGTYTALITPFSQDALQVNEDSLKKLIHRQLEEGIDGLLILGSTGEAPTLSRKEQDRVISLTVNEVNRRVPVMVGTGNYSTEQTILNTKRAEELGADMALIVTPYYNKPTPEGIFRHFKAIAKSSSLPIIIYNTQGRTGKNINPPLLKRLSEIKEIIAIKDCSENIDQMMDFINLVVKERPDFKVLSGDDSMTLPLIALGGHGIISVASNLIVKPLVKMVYAALNGDFNSARSIHYELLPLFRALFIETNPIPIKTIMDLCGYHAGPLRLPLCEMSEENTSALQNVLKNLKMKIL
ncbi:MAG: 4-hydroxy-tetrahydrodipicolinate synthase [Chlamydiales bacterium]|nr:4-hydroxy-tetrahydrodipicolinate synthase [Chlamydiales bacterium]